VEAGRKDLCLVFQPPERACMNYTITVTLKFVSVGMRQFRIPPALGLLYGKPKAR
jgi:hypothetical protein